MKNKVLAMLLALCMVMSLLPVAVFANAGDKTKVAPSAVPNTYNEGNGPTGENPHKRTCTVSNNCTCVEKTEGENAAADTYAWSTLCQACTDANCGTAEQQSDPNVPPQQQVTQCTRDENCVLADGHSTPHEYACACSLANCGYDGHEDNTCTKHVSNVNDLCMGCKANKAMADAAAEEAANQPAKRDCAQGASDPANSARTNCQKDEHQADCAMACKATGETGNSKCTLTKNHTGKHNSTECTKDDQCGAASGHDAQCPQWTAPTDKTENDGSVTRTGRTSVKFKVSVTCLCNGPHSQAAPYVHSHVVVSGAHIDDAFDIEVEVFAEYTYTVAYTGTGNDKKEDATATETARKTAEDTAKQGIQAPQANEIPNADKLCDYCKAAIAAEEAKDEAEAYADCNMTAECQKGVEGAKHNDDCLSLCTMNDSCKNTAGDANAHVVKYAVIKTTTTYKNVVEDQGQVTNPGVVDDETPATTTEVFKFLTYAEARAYVDDQDTYGAVNQGKREGYKFEIRTVHCPKSGGVDSTVLTVEADGTTTETKPAEETKAPEKAEDLADVDGTEWFAEELTSLIKKGIFTGSLDDGKYSFKAKDEMSTDMLVVLVSRVLDKGLNTTGADWAKEATAWAAEEGLTEGVEAGKVTRKDVILVLWRAAGSPESEASLEKFVDAEGLEGDQLTAMKWAVETGIVKGNDKNELNGDAVIIRSEMVAVIARFDGVVNK